MKFDSKKRKKYVERYLEGKKVALSIVSFIFFLIGAALVGCSFLLEVSDEQKKIFLYIGLVVGLVFFIIFLISLACKRNPIKAKQYELLVKEDRFLAYEKIVDKLHISIKDLANIQPILIFSPAWNFSMDNKMLYVEKLNKYHYLLEQLQSITFGKRAIFLYSNVINHASGTCFENKVTEFLYRDVVSIETKFVVDKLVLNFREILFMEITLRSGKVVSVILRDRIIDSPVSENDALSLEEENIIKTLKKAIRQKR